MKVTKEFDFCYGHRLSNYEGKCFNLHGHNGYLEVTIEGEENEQGMVLDFGTLKEIVNRMLDENFDHKTILKESDPLNRNIVAAFNADSFYLVNYNPTAENMAHDIYNQLDVAFDSMNLNQKIVNIRLYETPTSYADYSK